MRESLHKYHMSIAKSIALRSTCIDKQVGCVLTDVNNTIIATGYNGAPAGYTHCSKINRCLKQEGASCLAVHAEINAIIKCPDIHRIHCIYVTLSPCLECIKVILNTSCKYIYYDTLSTKSMPAKSVWLLRHTDNTWQQVTGRF